MILKGRLKLIYNKVPPCEVLADIGTDHALIPAQALLDGRCRKAIACDVKKGPLERADRTRKAYHLEERMELRLGSGLEPISMEESDCVVLAGMGGILMTELLGDSLEKARKARCLVLQPMVAHELVRPYLWQNGFEVTDEALAKEGEKLYQVLTAHYTGSQRTDWKRLNAYIGELLVKNKDPLLQLWIEERLNKQRKIVAGLMEGRLTEEALLEEERQLLSEMESLYAGIRG
ncbi:MAG: class I SAM-dependent methyltransferase [Clostridia bacterium]|nr:class I SAM-dependent methyltransferase [Clostridia bacterium]